MGLIRKKRTGVILTALGVVFVSFGILWVTVIFPDLTKVPVDLEKSVQYQGTVTVLDTETYQPLTYDAIVTRTAEAVRHRGDVVYINEEVSFVDSKTGQEIPSLHESDLLAVDRISRTNVPGHGDQNREGLWQFPLDVKAGQNYPVWVTGSPITLEARYVGEEDFKGLHVLVYEVATPDGGLTMPSGMFVPEMRLYRQIRLKVEPASGVTVYLEDTTKRTAKIPVFDELFPSTGDIKFVDMTVYEAGLVFTDETIEQQVHDASFYHWALSWGGTYLPWLLFGLGTVMALLGTILIIGRRIARVPIAKTADNELAGAMYQPQSQL